MKRILAGCLVFVGGSLALAGPLAGPNSFLKGMSVFPGWGPGGGLAGVWAVDYTAAGQPISPTFTSLLTEGDGRLVNTAGGDVDGDGTNEVLLCYHWADNDSSGIWMFDVAPTGQVNNTFTAIDSFGDGRAIDVAVGDLGTGDGTLEVLLAQSFVGGGVDTGVWAFNVDTNGAMTNFHRVLTLDDTNLYSVGAGDIDNDGSLEVLIGEHRGTVDANRLSGTDIELFFYETDASNILAGATSLGTFTPSNPSGGWLGLAGGDLDNDGVVEGVYIQNNWNADTNGIGAGPAMMFEISGGGAFHNLISLNLDDFNRRTDPGVIRDVNPFDLRILATGESHELSWPGSASTAYQAQYAELPASNTWFNLGPVVVGDGGTSAAHDTLDNATNRIYRVLQLN